MKYVVYVTPKDGDGPTECSKAITKEEAEQTCEFLNGAHRSHVYVAIPEEEACLTPK